LRCRARLIVSLFAAAAASSISALAIAHLSYRTMLLHERANKVLAVTRSLAATLDGDVQKSFDTRAAEQAPEFKRTQRFRMIAKNRHSPHQLRHYQERIDHHRQGRADAYRGRRNNLDQYLAWLAPSAMNSTSVVGRRFPLSIR